MFASSMTKLSGWLTDRRRLSSSAFDAGYTSSMYRPQNQSKGLTATGHQIPQLSKSTLADYRINFERLGLSTDTVAYLLIQRLDMNIDTYTDVITFESSTGAAAPTCGHCGIAPRVITGLVRSQARAIFLCHLCNRVYLFKDLRLTFGPGGLERYFL